MSRENQLIFEIVHTQVSLVFPIWPPLFAGFITFLLLHEGKPKGEMLLAKIWGMVTKEVAFSLPQEVHSKFFCNLFLVMKVTRELRPVINLKPLNCFLHNPHFEMDTPCSIIKSVSPGDWSLSTDLAGSYFHVPIPVENGHLLLCL